MGIQINPGHGKGKGSSKGVYMRLFSDFYISDIILASPIGLRLAIENKKIGDKATADYDFLSSIEVAYLYHSDVMFMQNWEHVDYIMNLLNKLPKNNSPDTDFSRVRPYFLDEHSSEHRQLILSSYFTDPEIQSLFRKNAKSLNGQIKLKKSWNEGSINAVASGIRQVFQIIPGVHSYQEQEEKKFQFFKENILSQILKIDQQHTLIVTPSYFSYVRVRNELIHQEVTYSN